MRDGVIAVWNASLSGRGGLDNCLAQIDNIGFLEDEYEEESESEDENAEEEEEDDDDDDDDDSYVWGSKRGSMKRFHRVLQPHFLSRR